jgi:predicted lipoprotein with Yx(FWY)xxD motif
MRNRWLAASVLAAAAVVGLSACGSSSSTTTPTSSNTSAPAAAPSSTSSASTDLAAGIKTATANGRVVLVTATGLTLYWYTPDTPTTSACTAACAVAWPPLIGTPSFASGVTLTGKLGTIKRADGQLQATYDGHPLYLFKSDTSAGMAMGNKLNGSWWIMTGSGKKIQAKVTTTSATSSSSGSGSSGSGSSGSSGSGSSGSSGGYGY